MKRIPCVVLGIGLSLLRPGPAALSALSGQSRAKPAQEPLQHETTVTHKLIQVYVVAPDGKPALDLEKSDFLLTDNDKPQVIMDFEKHFLSAPVERLSDTKPEPLRDAASLMNRKLLFVLDYGSNDLAAIGKSKKTVLQFLDSQVQPGDEIGLFSFSGMRGLVLHEYLTSDHDKIRTTLKKVLDVPGGRIEWDPWADGGHSILGPEVSQPKSAQKGDRAMIATTPAGGSSGGIISVSERGSPGGTPGAGHGGARSLAECLQELSKALRHIPGQKNIVLFSRGFGGRVLSKPRERESKAYQAMSKALASANSPVFSVNTTTGTRVFGDGSLEHLSQLTGGKYFADINYAPQIVQEIHAATTNYYVLGYSIASDWDGKFHDIRVEVKKPGYKVFAQRAYFNPLRFSQLTPVEKHLHLLDLALGEKAYFEQHLNFPLIALPFADDRESNTALISDIPVTTIREVVGDSTEFILLVFDPARTIVDSRRVEVDWSTIRQETIRHYSTLGLAPGRYDCRVVIRNLASGRAAVGACPVEISATPAATWKLFPPLLFKSAPGSPYLHIARQENRTDPRDVSLSLIYPFPAKSCVPLLRELEPGTSSIYAALRCAGSDDEEPGARIAAWLEPDGGGEKSPLPCAILHGARQDKLHVYFLEFRIPDLKPGRYLIRIQAEDAGTGSMAETESRFSIGSGPSSLTALDSVLSDR